MDCGKTRAQTKIDMMAIKKDIGVGEDRATNETLKLCCRSGLKLWGYDRGFEICGKFWSGGGIVEVERQCKP